MKESLQSILASEVDSELCNGIFDLLIRHHGENFDPEAIPIEHRTVLLVWHTLGIVGNGGFNHLFEAYLPGDPDFSFMLSSYEELGSDAINAVIHPVFDAFPDRRPSRNKNERLRSFVKANNAVKGTLNRDFLKAEKAIISALADYIRNNSEAFAGIDQVSPGKKKSSPSMSLEVPGKVDPVGTGLARLPRWARVAFYAHISRLVLPLWEEFWPEAPYELQPAIEQAIVLAELSAKEAKPIGDLNTVAGHATRAAGSALVTQSGINDLATEGPPPLDPNGASLVARAAALTIEFIQGNNEVGSYGCVKSLAEDRDELMEQISADFQKLKHLSRDQNWTDKTPVPPEVFRDDYKPQVKSWWKVW